MEQARAPGTGERPALPPGVAGPGRELGIVAAGWLKPKPAPEAP